MHLIILITTGAHNFDFSLANSVTIFFFFDFGKDKSQAKKITPIVGPWVSKDAKNKKN